MTTILTLMSSKITSSNNPSAHSFEMRLNQKRTPSERMADLLTSRLGSTNFLIANAALFAAWILVNTGMVPGLEVFDPFPFGLLTMIVSLEAIFLAIIVLISQNRAAKVDDLRDEVDLYVNTTAEKEITKMLELQTKILEKLDVDISLDRELSHMLKPTNLTRVENQIEKETE